MFKTAAIKHIGVSEIGFIREENQDIWKALPDIGVYLLADGMGGYAGGRLAATIAIEAAEHAFSELGSGVPKSLTHAQEIVSTVIKRTNQTVYEQRLQSTATKKMGTTFVALWVLPTYAILAHVGDSRIYCFREDQLQLLTQDHVKLKGSSLLLSAAVGIQQEVKATITRFDHKPEDLFMLCSDGLSHFVSDKELEQVFQLHQPIDMTADQLIKSSLEKGGKDNTTVVLVQL